MTNIILIITLIINIYILVTRDIFYRKQKKLYQKFREEKDYHSKLLDSQRNYIERELLPIMHEIMLRHNRFDK